MKGTFTAAAILVDFCDPRNANGKRKNAQDYGEWRQPRYPCRNN